MASQRRSTSDGGTSKACRCEQLVERPPPAPAPRPARVACRSRSARIRVRAAPPAIRCVRDRVRTRRPAAAAPSRAGPRPRPRTRAVFPARTGSDSPPDTGPRSDRRAPRCCPTSCRSRASGKLPPPASTSTPSRCTGSPPSSRLVRSTPDDVARLDHRAVLDRSQLRHRLAERVDDALDVGIRNDRSRALRLEAAELAHFDHRPDVDRRRVAKRRTWLDGFGFDVRRTDDGEPMLVHGLLQRLFDQAPEDLTTDLIAEDALEHGTRRLARPEPTETRACCPTDEKARSISACTDCAGTSMAIRLRTGETSSIVALDSSMVSVSGSEPGARGGSRTPTVAREILSLVRLPVPPLSRCSLRAAHERLPTALSPDKSLTSRRSGRELDDVALGVAEVDRLAVAPSTVADHRIAEQLDTRALEIRDDRRHVGAGDAEAEVLDVAGTGRRHPPPEGRGRRDSARRGAGSSRLRRADVPRGGPVPCYRSRAPAHDRGSAARRDRGPPRRTARSWCPPCSMRRAWAIIRLTRCGPSG